MVCAGRAAAIAGAKDGGPGTFRKKRMNIIDDPAWHRPRVTLLKEADGSWRQVLVQHRKETGPDGARVHIIKKFRKFRAAA